jgi:hypothetical protein
MCATRLAHLISLYFIIQLFGGEYKLCNSLWNSLQPAVTSFLLRLNMPCPQTLNLSFALNVRDQVLDPNKTIGTDIVLNLYVFDSNQKDKALDCLVASISQI